MSSINLSLCKDEKGLIGNDQAYPICCYPDTVCGETLHKLYNLLNQIKFIESNLLNQIKYKSTQEFLF